MYAVAQLQGARTSPIGPKSMQNSMFLALWRLIFALKTKIDPQKVIGVKLGEEPEMVWTGRSGSQST